MVPIKALYMKHDSASAASEIILKSSNKKGERSSKLTGKKPGGIGPPGIPSLGGI